MKRFLLISLAVIYLSLLLGFVEEDLYDGDELAIRSEDSRITQIAHITTNPSLTANETEAKYLWDTLFTQLCEEDSTYNHSFFYRLKDIEDWLSYTPKEILAKSYNGAHVFYMQNLRTFRVAEFMCATYNSKIYLLPVHLNDLIKDMGITITATNRSFIMRKYIEMSTSSIFTITDSSEVISTSLNETWYHYNGWEQRNGYKHKFMLSVCDSLIIDLLDSVDGDHYTNTEVILDNDNKIRSIWNVSIPSTQFRLLSGPTRPILTPGVHY